MKKILVVVGTRPNFIKVTQFPSEIKKHAGLDCKIVHTGQHFDKNMADVFFEQFRLQPDIFLNVEAGSPISQMADIMKALEKTVNEYKPDLMIVPGDVNSTLAGALTANKMNLPIAHLESGLRSLDRAMPEEFNRVLTDDLSDYFFVTEQSGYDNLINEGKNKDRIYFVGNTMIDTLVAYSKEIDSCGILNKFELTPKKFLLMTMHRPGTVDSLEGLKKLNTLIKNITGKYNLVFPAHPRTLHNLEKFGLLNELKQNKKLILSEPLDYFSFQRLVKDSLMVITDSGGIQEESTFLGVPCLTLRPNTERPVTVTLGTNELIPFDEKLIESRIESVENGAYKKGAVPPMWDGKATERILKIVANL
jgi:UDP-N-acetylglucosamine 2-epimerase (non-hydrolysing)